MEKNRKGIKKLGIIEVKSIENRIENDKEYYLLVRHILNNIEFRKISNCIHHGTTRLDHSLRVSYCSYLIAKKLKWDYESTARGGLMHDFFYNERGGITRDGFKSTFTHNKKALYNSEKYFGLDCKEKDIIEKHMFPINVKPPIYKESIIVSIVDKFISIMELNRKLVRNIIIWSIIFTRL